MSDEDNQPGVPALERGLNILRLFTRRRPTIAPPEMARELGIPRSTVHRLLLSLEQMDLLRRVEGGTAYALGPGVLRLGFEYLGSLDLVQLSNPILARLRDETNGSTHLTVRSGTDIIYLSRHPSRAAIISNVSVGTALPAHATIMGRMLLCALTPEALRALYPQDRLKRFTPQSPATLSALLALLAEDRRRGYAASSSYFEPGITSAAAPIRDQANRIVAAINVTLVEPSPDAALLHGRIKDQVCAAAADISMMLGAPMAPLETAPPLPRRVGT